MIIKSLTRTSGRSGSAAGLMNYMFQREKIENQLKYQTRDDNLSHLSLRHLMEGSSVNEWIDEFESNQEDRKYKREGMVMMYHDIISFAVKDSPQLNNDKLKDMARQYIRMRSPDAPAVATFHHDAKHLHIHIALAGSKYKTGMANRVSKYEFASIKQRMEEYQIATYPELINSRVDHRIVDEPKATAGKISLSRKEVSERIKDIIPKAASIEELYQLLEEEDMHPYERGGRVYGVKVNGLSYRFSTMGLEDQLERIEQEDFEMAELGQLRSERNVYQRSTANNRLNLLDEMMKEEQSLEDNNPEVIDDSMVEQNPGLEDEVMDEPAEEEVYENPSEEVYDDVAQEENMNIDRGGFDDDELEQ